ncbi:MAG TPA: hypothetical protein VFP52_14890, partial [Myxococcales bacterium]|nr:hypothetical protein [Myxococcales bacterium]
GAGEMGAVYRALDPSLGGSVAIKVLTQRAPRHLERFRREAEVRTRRLEPLPAVCALFCVFFIANKIYSPQYWLWVVALLALAALPAWLAGAVSVIALADYAASFSRLHLQADRVWAQALWFDGAVFWPMVALRYLALAACAAWAFSRAVRRSV